MRFLRKYPEYNFAVMKAFRPILALAVISCWIVPICAAQSLGDAARQQKQKKASSPTPAKVKHVITNEDIGSQSQSTDSGAKPETGKTGKNPEQESASASDSNAPSGPELQARIKEHRQRIAQVEAYMKDLQQQMEPWKTSDCTHILHAGTSQNTCDIPQKLTADYEKAKGQLQEEKTSLEATQEQARRLGYGNSFYDPK